jgi:hypothetical protein
MRNGADIRTYTAEEIRAMRRRGEDRTGRAKVDAMTEADLARAIAASGSPAMRPKDST